MRHHRVAVVLALLLAAAPSLAAPAAAQEQLPWQSRDGYGSDQDRGPGGYRGDTSGDSYRQDTYRPEGYRSNDGYGNGGSAQGYGQDGYGPGGYGQGGYGQGDAYSARRGDYPNDQGPGYGEPYAPPPESAGYDRHQRTYPDNPQPAPPRRFSEGTYEQGEIIQAGHSFFGSISQGLASAIEYAFKSQGRPNGYILGQDAGGAFVLGLRYGEGKLHTKDAGTHPVFWQGPSVGYDAGAEGSKTMVLVYNLRDPSEIYHRFAGVQGAAYLVGGVSLQFQKYGDVMLGVIRSGVGLRLGANIGYLKYTRTPTWNPL
jgi:hypothetical protein